MIPHSMLSPKPRLPLELPLREALAVYLRRLGVFSLVIILNLVVFAIYLVISPVTVLAPALATPEPEPLVFPLFESEYFEESFGGELGPAWRILEGSPVIEDAGLTSRSGVLALQFVADLPPEYAVHMRLSRRGLTGAYFAWEASASVRYLITYSEALPIAEWQRFAEGTWYDLASPSGVLEPETLEFLVTNYGYATFSNGELVSTLPVVAPEAPGFILVLTEGLLLELISILVP